VDPNIPDGLQGEHDNTQWLCFDRHQSKKQMVNQWGWARMAGADVDACSDNESTETLEIAVMRLWAAAMQIEQCLCPAAIHSVAGLQRAIEAARHLPQSIGWTDSAPDEREL
jgi:hypothetical protein